MGKELHQTDTEEQSKQRESDAGRERTHEERRGKFKRRNGQIGTDHMDQEKTQNDNFLLQLAFC